MFAANRQKVRPRMQGSGKPKGLKGLWILALVGISLAAVMGLMMASADQTPYGATQVWSAEPAEGVYSATSSAFGSRLIGVNEYGQDAGSIPAATLIHVGAQ